MKSREPIFHHPKLFGSTIKDIKNQMIDDNFWEVRASGQIYEAKDIVEILVDRYNQLDYLDCWKIQDFKVKQIDLNTFLATYVLIQANIRFTRRATLWSNLNSVWRIIYHQGTVIQQNHITT